MVITEVDQQTFKPFYNLFTELMQEGYGHFPPELRSYFLRQDYSEQVLSFWLERNLRKILLLGEPKNPDAFLVGDHSFGGVSFISWLGVRKALRGRGMGGALLKYYEDYARSRKSHLIELFTFDDVKPFYERHGYKEIGRRPEGYYGQKNVIMNKSLGKFDPQLLKA